MHLGRKCKKIYGDDIIAIEFMTNVSKLQPLYDAYVAADKLVKLIEEDGEKDATLFCIGGTGTLEDAKKKLTNAKEKFFAVDPNDLKHIGVAVITFTNVRAALECSNGAILPGGKDMITRMSPFKDDIYWANLHHSESERKTFSIIGLVAYCALILFFSNIMIALTRLADLNSLAEHSGLVRNLTESNPALSATIQGLIPVILLSVFFAILPIVLWVIVGLSRPQCQNDQEGSVLPKYSDCLIGCGLLVPVFATLLADPDSFSDINDIAQILSDKLPGQSTLYMAYVLNAALFGIAMELSGIVYWITKSLLGGEQPEMIFYTAYPSVIMMYTITLTYSVQAPLTLLWGLIYFGLSYWVWKYQLLYVYKPKLSSYTWKNYSAVFNRLHGGIFIMQLVLIGSFTTNGAFIQAGLTLVTLIATKLALDASLSDYGYYYERPSLETSVNFDMEMKEKYGKRTFTADELFVAPCVEALKAGPDKELKATAKATAEKVELTADDEADKKRKVELTADDGADQKDVLEE